MAELVTIRESLTQHAALQALAAQIQKQPGQALHCTPLIGAGRIPLIAALAAVLARPIVYVVGSSDAALRAFDDLRQWLDAEQVLLFPAADALPYEHMSPGIDLIAGRMRVLRRLSYAEHKQSCVIVTPIKALSQPTLSPADLAEGSVLLRRGDEHNLDELLERWIAMGYRQAPSVEEPGELNRRGGIVDIFPPGDELPLRIEFFGDEIDSLRRFDPINQRSDSREREALVGPAHEIALWRCEQALERLYNIRVTGLRREALSEWQAALERLEGGERFEGRAFFAPFFASHDQATLRLGSLLDHLSAQSLLFFNELTLLHQHLNELDRQSAERRLLQIEAGELPTDFPRPYLTWPELLERSSQSCLLDLSNNDTSPFLPHAQRIDLPETLFLTPELFGGQLRRLVEDIHSRVKNGEHVVIVTPQAARIQEMVNEGPGAGDQGSGVGQTPDPRPETPNPKPTEDTSWESGMAPHSVDSLVASVGEGGLPQAQPIDEHDGLKSAKHIPSDNMDLRLKYSERGQFSISRDIQSNASAQQAHHPSSFTAVHGSLDEGFRSPDLGLTLYSDTEIFGWRQRRPVAERRRRRDRSAEERATFLRGLKLGDYVVHIEHGIAQYDGLVRRNVGGIERDYLNLQYASGDRLYVPVDQIDRVSRYIGAGDAAPQLTRLGTQEWERAKRKARQAVEELADELIQLYAERQLADGFAFSPDTEWQRELEASFPYVETADQLRALIDVKNDMELSQPMDRLICGDVGFGKTEVALRAAFKAVQDGKQVAILVPTTVLAQQHYDTFMRRMAAFPVKIAMISRFRTAKEQQEIVHQLWRGEIDIVIGTHRLLSKDISFKNLGLLVIDEEQRFGVRHKERIKTMRANVDVLTLTATPIPRTLHMALAGIRDLSVIDTAPEDRLPIKTYVLPYEDATVREAMLRELERGGQIYFVHNRVHSIYYIASKLKQLVPEAEIAIGHGQLEERQLERVMLEFFSGKDDVLVCTTIIESGLDVPNANTLIIDDATNYGLAQLYQLRGRVGRSAQRAYAYLLYHQDKPMTPEAQERLEAIQEATELGAGFRIAMRDLEIRGAGNLLGAEQSGHIAAVGFDLYSRLLEQAVKTLKSQLIEANLLGSSQKSDASSPMADGSRQKDEQEAGTRNDVRTEHSHTSSRIESAQASEASAPHIRPRRQTLKVDEKVLVAPLVTLDLPLDAYLPNAYVPDERVRLSVYQRMAEAQTPEAVRELRNDLRDRFGDLPEAAESLLQWLLIKAMALRAGVSSIVTTDEEFIVRLPDRSQSLMDREKLRRRYGRDASVRIGPQYVRLDRRSLNRSGSDEWLAALTGVLETLT